MCRNQCLIIKSTYLSCCAGFVILLHLARKPPPFTVCDLRYASGKLKKDLLAGISSCSSSTSSKRIITESEMWSLETRHVSLSTAFPDKRRAALVVPACLSCYFSTAILTVAPGTFSMSSRLACENPSRAAADATRVRYAVRRVCSKLLEGKCSNSQSRQLGTRQSLLRLGGIVMVRRPRRPTT